MKTSDRNGFSAVELMVAITLIAVVVMIGYPAMRKARQISLSTRNISQLKQIGVAYLAYAAEHQGYTPRAIRHETNERGPWFGTTNAFGAPARQLFDRANPRWGANAEGTTDYLQSPDVLYSPFYKPTAARPKGTFASNYGYLFMYSPASQPLVSGFVNDHVRNGATMPLCSDAFGSLYDDGLITSDRCAVVYLDGGVVSYPQSELRPSRRDYNQRFRFLLQR